MIGYPLDSASAVVVNKDPAWEDLHSASDLLPELLADLRSPLPVRLGRMSDTIARMERVALVLIPKLLAYRDEMFPDASSWHADSHRHPQPDPVLLLAVREWVWSMATEPSMPLLRQKRLNAVLTEILVARAAVQAYYAKFNQRSPAPLVHTLNALWLLVAASWKLRPLLAEGEKNHA